MVYCVNGECRNNLGDWKINAITSNGKTKTFAHFAKKDLAMSRDANYAFMLWDGKSKGTLNNVINMLEQGKNSRIYFAPEQYFLSITSVNKVKSLVSDCNVELMSYFDKTINFSK